MPAELRSVAAAEGVVRKTTARRVVDQLKQVLLVGLALALVVPLFLLNFGCVVDGGDDEVIPSLPERAAVIGYLTTAAGSEEDPVAGGARSIYVANVEVWLRREDTGADSDRVRTDLSGRYRLPPQEQATYRVCWEAPGFVGDCAKPFDLGNEHTYREAILISPERGGPRRTFYGRVRFADGSIPRTLEPMANVNAFVVVTALDAGGSTLGTAHANNYGEYVLPGIPATNPTRIDATIEKSLARATIDPNLSPASGVQRVDFTFRNTPPALVGLQGDAGAGRHWSAPPGAQTKVTAEARDVDGDTLAVRWVVPDGTSDPPQAGNAVTYQLPNRSGLHEFEAVISDGRGGYTKDQIFISTDGVRFSGRVRATNAAAVQGAQVEINGQTATTGAEGFFELVVPERRRYVVNMRQPGYQLLSKVYDTGILGGTWTLTRASVTTADPTSDVDVTDTRRPADCPGSLLRQARERGDPQLACGPGIRLRIPANSLVDSTGAAPAGPVDVALSTVDVQAPDGMLGDYTAEDANGDQRVMETFGAGWVEITGGGKTYDLAAGTTAELVVPIPPTQLAAASIPAQVPFLAYDAAAGLWREEGVAARSGNAYVAKLEHLSAFNIDLLFQNQACVRVDAVGMPPKFRLEIEVPSASGGPPTIKSTLIDNSLKRFHVLYNVPTNVAMTLRAFEDTNPPVPIELALPNPTGINPPPKGFALSVNSGPTQTPPTPNLPPFPYKACQGFSGPTPGPLPAATLVAFKLPPNVVDEFLSAFGLAENLTADITKKGPWEAQANDYYGTIDPLNLRTTLADFRSRNGFGTGEVVAVYANSADLGFGREMHCQKRVIAGLSGHDVACYVTNYGNKDSDDVDDFTQALAAKNNPAKPGAVATVGMEYSRVENPSDSTGNTFANNTRVVKFYVWLGPTGSPRLPSADLDGYGARPVPQLCMVCHGGRYPSGLATNADGTPNWQSAADVNLGSNFIAFDLRGLTVPTLAGFDHKADQQDEFKLLNEHVRDSNPSQAIADVVADMYGGSNPNVQDENSEIAGWSGTSGTPSEKETYREVIAASCRTCHLSQGSNTTQAFIEWDEASQINAYKNFVSSIVCDSNFMPHAVITHRRFWLNPNPFQGLILADYLGNLGPTSLGTNCRP